MLTSKSLRGTPGPAGAPPSPPVMALRISRAASSRISMDACSLYQAAWGVQIRLGASFRGPWLKLGQQSAGQSHSPAPALHQTQGSSRQLHLSPGSRPRGAGPRLEGTLVPGASGSQTPGPPGTTVSRAPPSQAGLCRRLASRLWGLWTLQYGGRPPGTPGQPISTVPWALAGAGPESCPGPGAMLATRLLRLGRVWGEGPPGAGSWAGHGAQLHPCPRIAGRWRLRPGGACGHRASCHGC